jgi:hypothetical protein
MELYKPVKSDRKNKKFKVLTKKGIIHFGDSRYKDFTQHKDKKRQESYCKRAKGIKNKKGELTYKDKESANYWSYNFLWKCKDK